MVILGRVINFSTVSVMIYVRPEWALAPTCLALMTEDAPHRERSLQWRSLDDVKERCGNTDLKLITRFKLSIGRFN
jgi:hypothetical protein